MLLRSFILTGAVQGVFFILLLKSKVKNSRSDGMLMAWMAIIALQLLFYYDNLGLSPVFPGYVQLISFSLPLLSAPVLYLYIRSVSFGWPSKWKSLSIHLLPYLIFNLTTFCLYYKAPRYLFLRYGFPHFNNGLNIGVIIFLTGLLAIVPGYYTIASFLVLLKYQKRLPDNYSYTEKINLNWLKWIVISLMMLFTGLFLFIKYGVNYGLVGYPNLFAVVGAVLAMYVFFMGFYGLRQNTALTDIPSPINPEKEYTASPSYKNSGLTDEWLGAHFIKLKQHLDEKKPFLDEDLSLAMLAGQLKITPNQLSQIINQKSATNFYNFINAYRVDAVKLKLKDPAMAHYSILSIAFDSGFRSKSAFNKIFKEVTGQTPLEYQKSGG
jgi:AraC-like DNA-binding protein